MYKRQAREAARFKSELIGTEHILIAIIKETDSVASRLQMCIRDSYNPEGIATISTTIVASTSVISVKERRRMIIHTIELQLSPHPPHPPQFVAAKSLM